MFFKFKVVYYLLLDLWYASAQFSRKRLLRLQQRRLKRWRKKIVDAPFYTSFVNQPLGLFPMMNKARFMAQFDWINTVGVKKHDALNLALRAEKTRDFTPKLNQVTVGLSSGTSGSRGLFLVSDNERARWAASVINRVIGWSWRHRTIAFFLRSNSNLYTSVQSRLIDFNFIDIRLLVEKKVQQLTDLSPDIIVAPPSVLVQIVRYCIEQGVNIKVQKVVSVAEVLTEEDRTFLSNYFRQVIHQVYQCTEGFLATTCEQGTLHFNEDVLLIEKRYIDKEKCRFHPIITDLLRWTQPVVRYELNDILHEGSACSCGRKTLTIKKIEGRSDDVFLLKDRSGKIRPVYPDLIRRAVITSFCEIEDYRVIQQGENKLGLYLRTACKDQYAAGVESVKSALNLLFDQLNLISVKICLLSTFNQDAGSKLRRVYRQFDPEGLSTK